MAVAPGQWERLDRGAIATFEAAGADPEGTIVSEGLLLGLIGLNNVPGEVELLLALVGVGETALLGAIKEVGGQAFERTKRDLNDETPISDHVAEALDRATEFAGEFTSDGLVRPPDLLGGLFQVHESVAFGAAQLLMKQAGLDIEMLAQEYPRYLSAYPELGFDAFFNELYQVSEARSASEGASVQQQRSDSDQVTLQGQRPDEPLDAAGGSEEPEERPDESLRTFEGHRGWIWWVVVLPDGSRTLSGSIDKALRLWDLETGETLHTFEGDSGIVYLPAVLPDGRRALSGSADQTLRLWDLETGETVHGFEGHTAEVYSVAVLPDGRRALSGSADQTLRLWDLETGETVHVLEGHTAEVYSVAVLPDGRRALSGSEDNTLRLWDLETGEPLHTFEGHTSAVHSVAVLPDGSRVLSGSEDNTLRLWDLETGEPLHTFGGHTKAVYSVAVLRDGRHALSASADLTLRLWDLETGEPLHTFEGHSDEINAVAALPDGRRALSGSNDRTLKLWDLSPYLPQPTPPLPEPQVVPVATKVHRDMPLDCVAIGGPDELGYGPYAGALFQMLTYEETGLPISLAVSAPWGSGKTSIMQWVKCEMDFHRKREPHACKLLPMDEAWVKETYATAEAQARERGFVRSFRTVWIDAWRFEESAALWATFTKAIYEQGQRQVGPRTVRNFWPRLMFRTALANRIEPHEKRGFDWRTVLWPLIWKRRTLLSGGVLAAAGALGGFFAADASITGLTAEAQNAAQGGATVLAGGVAGFVGLITAAKGWLRQPFSFNLNKASEAPTGQPAPVDHVGAPADIQQLVRLLAPGKDDGLAVFIDDLDRCSPSKVKDAVEAINLLFAAASSGGEGGPPTKIVFILGMDSEMVASSMRVAYAETVEELRRRDPTAADDFGHRFLSKIVQLSFDIPDPRDTSLVAYLDGLLGPEVEVASATATVTPHDQVPVDAEAVRARVREEV